VLTARCYRRRGNDSAVRRQKTDYSIILTRKGHIVPEKKGRVTAEQRGGVFHKNKFADENRKPVSSPTRSKEIYKTKGAKSSNSKKERRDQQQHHEKKRKATPFPEERSYSWAQIHRREGSIRKRKGKTPDALQKKSSRVRGHDLMESGDRQREKKH